MADEFLSFMVFIFKALFLKTLKFQICRFIRVDNSATGTFKKLRIFKLN